MAGSGSDRAASSTSGAGRDEVFAARLSDPNVDIALKLRSAQDLRDEVSREGYQGTVEYLRFVDVVLPAIVRVLSEGTPIMWSCPPEVRTRLLNEGPSKHPHGQDALQNGLRHLLLETLHRLVHHDPLRPHALSLTTMLLKLMETENEENAILALKIIIDLHRTYKDTIGSTAQGFLELVKKVYQNMPEVLQRIFGDEDGVVTLDPEDGDSPSAASGTGSGPGPGPAAAAAATPHSAGGAPEIGTPGSAGGTAPAPPLSARSVTQQSSSGGAGGDGSIIKKLPLGIKSLKLLAECPIAVVFLFQTYRDMVPNELRIFVPLIFQFLELQAAPQRKAHDQARERGETFIGLCPALQNRRAQFTDLIIAEVKTMSFVAYFLRMSYQSLQSHRNVIPELVVRFLKECPAEGASHRKELLIAARHILQTDFRNAFVPYIDTLVDDRVIIGFGVTCHEQLRPLAYSMIADLVHHVRDELGIVTLAHVVHIYSCNLHDSTLAPSIQTMCSKLLLNLTENVVKADSEEAGAVLSRSLEAFVTKVEAIAASRDQWKHWSRSLDAPKAEGDLPVDEVDVERAKPIAAAAAIADPGTDLMRDTRFLLRNLIFALKTTIHGLRHVRAPLPGAPIVGRLFAAITKCMLIFDTRSDGGKEHREVMEGFAAILLSIEPLVFLEVVETNMPFFLEELLKNQELLAIPQSLLADNTVSQLFVGIAFRFLVSKLERLGHGDAEFDSIVLRLFKMSFMAVTIFPETNEVVLQPHLAHIIMHSLKLASKAPEPGCYYLLLRVLFRSIGGGRFELLYKEVIPLLESLLTTLNNLLSSAERSKRDLFVELCLTVPVRLSVLLPYLSHLMKPLVLSLQAGPDLISQGLRTLELCVDNLTPEFLNPLMAPVQQEINAALWKLLRPLPYSHMHAHTTVRILGKIGGRNRKQLGPPLLNWRNVTDEATTSLSFDGKTRDIPISSVVDLALRMIRRGDLHYRRNAYQVLKHSSVSFLKETLATGDQEKTFGDVLRGLFEACRIDEFSEDATAYVRNLAKYIFSSEIARQLPEDAVNKLSLPLSSALLDGLVEGLATVQHSDIPRLADQVVNILSDLTETCRANPPPREDLPAALLHQLALRLGSLCYDHSWQRKSGGALGIDLVARRLNLGRLWLIQHEGDLLRALLFMLKDMPIDPPGNVDNVVDTILFIVKTCNEKRTSSSSTAEVTDNATTTSDGAAVASSDSVVEDKRGEDAAMDESGEQTAAADTAERAKETSEMQVDQEGGEGENKQAEGVEPTSSTNEPAKEQSQEKDHSEERDKAQKYIVGFLVVELASQVEVVRKTAQKALQTLADLNGVALTDMISPVKLRLLKPIFTKPLRALAFPMQIGHMDAITFCMNLQPPLLELEDKDRPEGAPTDETEVSLGRLLTEALGIADADDAALTGGKPSHHSSSTQLTQLRVVCVRLLSAAMSSSDFLAPKHTSMRNKILQVYFKLLYAKSPPVVNAAYECLKTPVQQGKLPKDLLQSGLRPVLVNLGDHKRLTVDSLQGLARLLELLPNYFKVEIGQKLLDHFRALANPATLLIAAVAPETENGEVNVMAAIINVFHLLPHPGAGGFLTDVCVSVVEVERQLRKTNTSPFTKPLAKYVNRYAEEAALLFIAHIEDEGWAATFRALIGHPDAETFREHIASSATVFFHSCFSDELAMTLAPLHGATVIREIVKVKQGFVKGNDELIKMLVTRWTSNIRRQRLLQEGEVHLAQVREDTVFLSIFFPFLESTDSTFATDLYLRIVDVFTYRTPSDNMQVAHFLFERIALSRDVAWKQAVLRRFIDFFANEGITPAHKTMALRYIVNPTLHVAFSRGDEEKAISDPDYMNLVHARIWQPWLTDDVAAGVSDDALRIEGLYMATLMVRNRWQVMLDCRKDVIKLGWSYIKTADMTTKAAAHCLIAQFLAVYDSKPKILMPIYTTLLRQHQAEARSLVKEALNVLTPELPTRCPGLEGGVHPWIRATRHILVEDGHSSVSQLTHIYSLMIRFPDVFYERRDLFIPQMVASMPKLCLLSTATAETRSTCIELMELILNWDKKRLQIVKEEENSKMDVDGHAEEMETAATATTAGAAAAAASSAASGASAKETGKTAPAAAASAAGGPSNPSPRRLASIAPSTTSQSSGFHAYTVPPSAKDSIVNGALIRFIASHPEIIARGGLGKKAIEVLRQMLDIWPDVSVKFNFLQRVLGETEISEQHLPMILNTVEVLSAVLHVKSDAWVRENIAALHRVTERGMTQQDARLHIAYKPILQRLLAVLPSPSERDAAGNEALRALADWAANTVNDGIRQMTNLHSTITVMEAWAAAAPDSVDGFMGALVRVVTTLTKEHLNTAAPTISHEVHLRLLRSCLQLFRTRMAAAGDGRRWVLSALCTLVEKSPSNDLCRDILDIAAKWVLEDHREAFPTNKEKATLLGKMMVFETRASDRSPERSTEEPLLKEFLGVILKVYSDPQLARSEYTVRLEQPFLLGCRNRDPALRCKFMEVFDQAITRTLHGRLNYILGIQNWDSLADTNWMHQALDLLMGAVDGDRPMLPVPELPVAGQDLQDFYAELKAFTTGGFVEGARKLLYSDPESTHAVWVALFRASWTCLSRKEQTDSTRMLITLLTKEYHLQNVDRRPNVIQTLLGGALACTPPLALPPHLIRYLGKTYNAYHAAIELLHVTAEEHRDEETIRESCNDALAETYAELSEDDFLYGLWRRRAFFMETNVSISFEQAGLWNQAEQMYESAQLKARSGSLPFTESEYSLWEDHWILCAEKLQQWDILSDLARQEGNNDLLLECSWRLSDWANEKDNITQAIENMIPVPTPRKRVFEALNFLVRSQAGEQVNPQDFQQLCDEGIQFSLRKWYHLPEIVSNSHIPLLHVFQQFVELQEAAKQIFTSLSNTNAQNLDMRSQELKGTLQAWRDRLPNLWDDVNIWSDLVAWRQHIFQAINRAYLPLLPMKDGQPIASANSHAYRGYHETAWIINRFAHVARKHQLTDVCISSLNKIYTLPNIEIQEAFLKLREQAKCHYQNPNELTQGLEVINNTNLAYFNLMQKSEFYTLKGMFLARLGLNEEANQVFGQAVTMDMSFPKVWAEYGRFHDRLFKGDPNDLDRAANAVSCYLQAAGLYKSGKVRKLLVRILWLLSLDDASGVISKAFDTYTGELPVWYWITFAPQLIMALGRREARYARIILLQIAKKYPQGLFFHLRTAREELKGQEDNERKAKAAAERQKAAAAAAAAAAGGSVNGSGTPTSSINPSSAATPTTAVAPPSTAPASSANGPNSAQSPAAANGNADGGDTSMSQSQSQANGEAAATSTTPGGTQTMANGNAGDGSQPGQQQPPVQPPQPVVKSALEHVEDIASVLKTAFPLLALSVELVCDQISSRFKAVPDEDIFRLVTALLQDGLQQYIQRAPNPDDNGLLAKATTTNIARFASNLPTHLRESFQEDFITSQPNLRQYVQQLQKWRDRYERILDRKPKRHPLENLSHWLVEYKYQTFDEIEVPGQYLRHDENNRSFVKISYFAPKVEVGRLAGSFTRRITMIGYDGSSHTFAVQLPAPRNSRREEKLTQLFRMLNGPLQNRVESRKRGLQFYLPLVVPVGQHTRLVESNTSITSLHDIYERYCQEVGMGKDDPVMAFTEKVKELFKTSRSQPNFVPAAAKFEAYSEIANKMFPDTIVRDYFVRSTASPSDLWHTRKQFTLYMAAFAFQTYIFSIGRRVPTNILISRAGGQMYTADLQPGFGANKPEFSNSDGIPFRLTPNLQTFITPVGIEGVLVSSLMSIARCLTESDYDLEHRLSIFISEEMQFWHNSRKVPKPTETQLRDITLQNIESIVRRARAISCKMEREKQPIGATPVNQTVMDVITQATNPLRLGSMDATAFPWL